MRRSLNLIRPPRASALLMLAILPAFARAQTGADEPPPTPREAEARAAEAFAREDWAEAIRNYMVLYNRGVGDPALYYNMGTTYARAGERGEAVWMLLRARRLDPRNDRIRRNLESLAPDLPSQIAVFPIPPVEILYQSFSRNEWAAFAGLATVLCGAALAISFGLRLGPRTRPIVRQVIIFAGITAGVCHAFSFIKYDREVRTPWAVVTANDTYPRSAPNENASTYEFMLPPGTVVRLGHSGVAGWVKAIYGGANEVFIRREQVKTLNQSRG